jgi:uncharacterized membrane protein
MPELKAFNIAIMALCAALYAVVGYLTSFGLTFGGVAFWPAAFVPAIFAVLFGPWEGGVGAAIGIFIRDSIVNGQPLLSLTVGVPANFAAFFLMGYLAHKKLDKKQTLAGLLIGIVFLLAGLLLPTVFFSSQSLAYTKLSTDTVLILFSSLMVISLALFGAITVFWKEFQSFSVGSIVGIAVGATIIAIGVWAYSQLFFGVNAYFAAPIAGSFASLIFVWTFVTEVPFVLLLSPPIIKACQAAFPFLRRNKPAVTQATQ